MIPFAFRPVVQGAVMTSLLFTAVIVAQTPTRRPHTEQASLGADGLFTTSDGVKLHYRSKGTGRAIVFVPGWILREDR